MFIDSILTSIYEIIYYHIYQPPLLGQDMTQGQFLSRVYEIICYKIKKG